MATASHSRPLLAGPCSFLLRRLARSGRLEIEYRNHGESRRIFLRSSQLTSDLQSALELAVGDCYRLGRLPEPQLIIDGGGNTGLFTLAASARWPRACIVVCEPVPDNVKMIQTHLRMNGIEAEVLPVCLGGAPGRTRFYCREAVAGSISPDRPYHSVIEVEVKTLSEVCRGRGLGERPSLIKLDIEGAEVDVLEEFLQAPRPQTTIVGELHRRTALEPRLLALLRRCGWRARFFDESPQASLFHLFSPDVARGLPAGDGDFRPLSRCH